MAGGAESIGLDDVGAGLEILGVDFFDHLRLGQLQQLEVALEMFRRMLRETSAAIFFFRKPVALHHRAHGAIENDDAFAKKIGERMILERALMAKGNLGGGRRSATNKLTHHDTSICC